MGGGLTIILEITDDKIK